MKTLLATILAACLSLGCATRPKAAKSTPKLAGALQPAGQNFSVAWDASPDASVDRYYLVAESSRETNRFDVGNVTKYSMTLPRGIWKLECFAVSANGISSEPSNALQLDLNRYFLYTLQHWQPSGTWTNVTSLMITNPPEGIDANLFRVQLDKQ